MKKKKLKDEKYIPESKEHQKERQKATLMKKLAMHNPKKTKLGIEAVRNEEGTPILEKEKALDHLGRHWGCKFQERQINAREADAFTRHFSNKFPSIGWYIWFLEFSMIIMSAKHSSPGPDGIPYAAWACDIRAQVILYSAYMMWMTDGYTPVFFNIAYLWLLPKGTPPDGIFNPSDTRPLSGANADAKIFAMALAERFNTVVNKWAIAAQRGFIRGRQMLQNVIDIETHAIVDARLPTRSAALIFFDFAAAFPSVARAFIWIALEAIGIPKKVIKAIQALYVNNIHFMKCCRNLRFAFIAYSGVRQGYPLSSTIFILVTDCLLNALSLAIGPHDMIRGYADDIGMVIRNIWVRGALISDAFACIARISALHLNGKKCVFIPLWSFS